MNPYRWKKPLRGANIDDMPNKPGVYGFWCRTNGRCIYIGKAEEQSIQTRVKQEWKNSHNRELKRWINCFGKFLDICYLPISHDKIARVDILETRLIRLWRPETNKNKQRK